MAILYQVPWRSQWGTNTAATRNTDAFVKWKFDTHLSSDYLYCRNCENHAVERSRIQNPSSSSRIHLAWAIQKSWSIDVRIVFMSTKALWTFIARLTKARTALSSSEAIIDSSQSIIESATFFNRTTTTGRYCCTSVVSIPVAMSKAGKTPLQRHPAPTRCAHLHTHHSIPT